MSNSADPDQLASSSVVRLSLLTMANPNQLCDVLLFSIGCTVCKGRIYPGSAGLGLNFSVLISFNLLYYTYCCTKLTG